MEGLGNFVSEFVTDDPQFWHYVVELGWLVVEIVFPIVSDLVEIISLLAPRIRILTRALPADFIIISID